MPSLIRFVVFCLVLVGLFYGSMFALATCCEPELRQVEKPIHNLKLRR